MVLWASESVGGIHRIVTIEADGIVSNEATDTHPPFTTLAAADAAVGDSNFVEGKVGSGSDRPPREAGHRLRERRVLDGKLGPVLRR